MSPGNATLPAAVSELLILRLLAERQLYGYELAKAVHAATQREILLREGLLYPLLHSMERRGLLRSRRLQVAGRPRIYYRSTAAGQRRLRELAAQWRRASAAVTAILGAGYV